MAPYLGRVSSRYMCLIDTHMVYLQYQSTRASQEEKWTYTSHANWPLGNIIGNASHLDKVLLFGQHTWTKVEWAVNAYYCRFFFFFGSKLLPLFHIYSKLSVTALILYPVQIEWSQLKSTKSHSGLLDHGL